MIHKVLSNIPRSIIASFLIIVFGALLLTLMLNHNWAIATLCFLIGVGFIILTAAYTGWSMKEAVARLSKEIELLPVDLSVKPYTDMTDETQLFYKTLDLTKQALDRKSRVRQELLEVVTSVASHTEIVKLLKELLPKLTNATRSSCSAFYSINKSTNKLELKYSVGFSKNIYSEFDLNFGEGLVGLAATRREITYYSDIPDDTIYLIRTFIGKLKPRSMMIVPVVSQDTPSGVLVCASIYNYSQEDKDMIELIRHYVGVAVSNSVNYERTKRLTNELQFQNKLIQDQHEQMKNRLDEKTQWLNSILRYSDKNATCAVDTRGIVLLWGEIAEQAYGVTAKNAVGKPFEKICEDAGWSPVAKVFTETLQNGDSNKIFYKILPSGERQELEMNFRSIYDEQSGLLGVIIAIKF